MAKSTSDTGAANRKSFHEKDLIPIQPLTSTQKELFRLYNMNVPVIANLGSAGTGKTLVSMYLALRDVLEKNEYYQLIIVRSCVPARDIGFLPGTQEEKEMVYQLPYAEACNHLFEYKDYMKTYQRLVDLGYIRFVSTSFLRGMTFDNAIVLVDEAQNATKEELATVMTRVGHHSKIIFCGDRKQSDMYRKKTDQSGLDWFTQVLEKMPSAEILNFEVKDVVRSGIAKEFLLADEEVMK